MLILKNLKRSNENRLRLQKNIEDKICRIEEIRKTIEIKMICENMNLEEIMWFKNKIFARKDRYIKRK